MSTPARAAGRAPAPPRPVRTGSARLQPQPPLRLVPQARPAAPPAPFLAVVVGLLATGLLGLLALNTLLAQDSFRLHEIEKESKQLADREQVLQREVAALQAPAELARRAEDLGMVPGGPPAFLRLSDGAVLGEAQPAPEPERSANSSSGARSGSSGSSASSSSSTGRTTVPRATAGTTSADASASSGARAAAPRATSSSRATAPSRTTASSRATAPSRTTASSRATAPSRTTASSRSTAPSRTSASSRTTAPSRTSGSGTSGAGE